MNRFYRFAGGLLLISTTAIAQTQTKTQMPLMQRVKPTTDAVAHNFIGSRDGVEPIWSDDFSDPTTWELSTWQGAPQLNWQIGVGLENTGGFPTAPVQSTTADNGYAMLDSDGFANQSLVEKSMMTTVNPIDLSNVDRVVLQFESFYRKWTYEECYIVVSTTNDDWPDLTPDTDISSLPNVFYAWPGMEVQAVINNPTLVRINISEVAGGQEQVWIRFHWTGTYGYSWFVDDVAIIEQPENDVVMNYSFLSHTGTGEEYGRIPQNQLNDFMQVGGEFYNFGFGDQTDVEMVLELFDENDVLVFDAVFSESLMATTDTVMAEEFVEIPTLESGLYRSVATVASNEESSDGVFFGNNSFLRNFEVSERYYSVDGLGIHPEENQAIGSIGSNSFEDAPDGLMVMAYYEVVQDLDVYGIEFLTTATSTELGCAVIASLHDSTDIRNQTVTNAIYQGDIYDLTEADIANGFTRILFPEVQTLAAGGYYAALELFSGSGEAHIRVLNDLTVPQPALASMIYIPDDQVYTNGNAIAVRLITDQTLSIADRGMLSGVNVFPNPTNGVLNISLPTAEPHSVEVFDLMGRNASTSVVNGNGIIDMTGMVPGVYMVRVSNGEAFIVQRVVVQ